VKREGVEPQQFVNFVDYRYAFLPLGGKYLNTKRRKGERRRRERIRQNDESPTTKGRLSSALVSCVLMLHRSEVERMSVWLSPCRGWLCWVCVAPFVEAKEEADAGLGCVCCCGSSEGGGTCS